MKYLSIALFFCACTSSQPEDIPRLNPEVYSLLDSSYIVNEANKVVHWDTVTTDTLTMSLDVNRISGHANGVIYYEKKEDGEWVELARQRLLDDSMKYWVVRWDIPKGVEVRARIETTGTQLLKVN